MGTKKKGLGRGLDALLGIGAEQIAVEEANGDQLKLVPVEQIQRGRYQPRIDMRTETLQELADSIKAQGVVQPVIIRPLGNGGRFELIAGERRWRAAQLAGLVTIPAVVRNVADAQAMSMALIENIQREQLNPIEEARALERLIEEFEMTHQQVAEAIGRSRAAVSNLLRLLELENAVREMLENGDLEMGHARAILALGAEQQIAIAGRVVNQGLSVRETEKLVRSMREEAASGAQSHASKPPDPNISELERSLSERLGTQVAVRHGRAGKGTVTIRYGSLDELDGILAHIK